LDVTVGYPMIFCKKKQNTMNTVNEKINTISKQVKMEKKAVKMRVKKTEEKEDRNSRGPQR